MDYNSYEFLDITVDDGVAFVINSSPKTHNAATAAGHREWAFVYRDLEKDPKVRAVLIGAKGKHFSVGPDRDFHAALQAGGPNGPLRQQANHDMRALVYEPLAFTKPVVCAIQGVALGSALTYCLMADVVIAERSSYFADPHVPAALVAGDGGALTFPAYMGVLRAKRYLLTGDKMTAEEAYHFGLVSEVVEDGDALTRAEEYARRFAHGPQQAIRGTKAAVNQWLKHGAMIAFDYSYALELQTLAVGDQDAFEELSRKGVGAIPPDPRETKPQRARGAGQ